MVSTPFGRRANRIYTAVCRTIALGSADSNGNFGGYPSAVQNMVYVVCGLKVCFDLILKPRKKVK